MTTWHIVSSSFQFAFCLWPTIFTKAHSRIHFFAKLRYSCQKKTDICIVQRSDTHAYSPTRLLTCLSRQWMSISINFAGHLARRDKHFPRVLVYATISRVKEASFQSQHSTGKKSAYETNAWVKKETDPPITFLFRTGCRGRKGGGRINVVFACISGTRTHSWGCLFASWLEKLSQTVNHKVQNGAFIVGSLHSFLFRVASFVSLLICWDKKRNQQTNEKKTQTKEKDNKRQKETESSERKARSCETGRV